MLTKNKTMPFSKEGLQFVIIIAAALLLVLGGCSAERSEADDSFNYLIYFANNSLVDSDERCPYQGFARAVSRSSPRSEGIAELLIEELIAGPGPQEKDVGPVLPADTRLLDLKVVDGTAYIDFSREAYGGTAADELPGSVFIDALVLTVTQFPAIVKTQVSVEGAPWADDYFTWDRPIGQYEVLPNS